jgi:hypothetical protein
MKFLSFTTLLPRLLATLLIAVGCLIGIRGITYFFALAYPTIATLRAIAFLIIPILLLIGGVGLFIGKRWSLPWLTVGFCINLLAGYPFVPYLPLLAGRLLPIPFAAMAALHAANFVVLALAWLLQVNRMRRTVSATPSSERRPEAQQWPHPGRAVAILCWVSLTTLALVIIVWPISVFRPIHSAGILGNPSLLMFHADILDITENRVWFRGYESIYFFPDAFHIEVMCGGMPFSTDTKHFTPLQHDWRFLGLRLGYQYDPLPYRADTVIDVAMPLWLIVLFCLPAPTLWLAASLGLGRRQ